MPRPLAVLFAAAFLLFGCKTVQTVSPDTLEKLKETPQGYLSGEVTGLQDFALLNNSDFVYSVAVGPRGERVAFSHLGAQTFQLGLWSLEPPRQIADPSVNPHQYDVEAVAFSPDGKTVAAVSRDGGLRLFSFQNGAQVGAYASEEPLVSVAFHPGGKYLAVGSSKGLITVLSFPGLTFAFEQRAHQDEVRALEFSAKGVLYSGGWDKSIAVFDTLEEQLPTDSARLRFERRGGFSVVRGTVSDKASAAFALDSRQPYVVITTEVAKAAGIDVPFLTQSATIATPLGQSVVKVAPDQSLSFKSLKATGLEVAVCDVCVPPDTQGILGESFTSRYEVAFDQDAGEVQLTARQAGQGQTVAALVLKPRARMNFDWFVNDVSLDHAGRTLGVAFSEVKAERTREIYEREKKKLTEPVREGNAGAMVDANTGAVLHKWSLHEGVVSTAAISPDGQTLATGGWDKRLYLNRLGDGPPLKKQFGWSVRKARFSDDGRLLAVGAWTPQNVLGDQSSDPSAVVYELSYQQPQVQGGTPVVTR